MFKNLLNKSDREFYINNAKSCWCSYLFYKRKEKDNVNIFLAEFYKERAKEYLRELRGLLK